MFRNYFKAAWRNLIKNKISSVINIVGLSIGISVCFIILMFVQYELSFDRFNTKADRIVRVAFKADTNGGKIFETNVMPPVASAMKHEYPGVEDATRIYVGGYPAITYKNKTFNNDKLAFVDPDFFSIFTLPFLEGNAKTALERPNTLVVTKAFAKKYFGGEDPIGQTLIFPDDNHTSYKITGLIKDIPANSHFHFDVFASMTGLKYAESDSWMTSGFYTYVLLKKGTDYKKLEAKLPTMVEKYIGPQIQQKMGISFKQFVTNGNHLGLVLQPLTSIHLHSHSVTELEPPGNATYVYIFGAIALFMLLIACINFINLSTASASGRAKEVGVRKVIGSNKSQLIKQFLFESSFIVIIALIISGVLIPIALPVFNSISGVDLQIGFHPKVIISFLLIGLAVSLFAGAYPSFYLSSFKPIAVLKGKMPQTNNSFGFRNGLVVFQFLISILLITGTIVVWRQMKYIQNKDLGYNKEHLLVIPNSYALGKNEQIFKNEMLRDSRIVNATVSGYRPADPTNSNNSMVYPAGHDNQIAKMVDYYVDENYIPTFDMQMVAGRNFSKNFPTDSSAIILNETAAGVLGWNDKSAIGKILVFENSPRGNSVNFHVIGVVKDFNFQSLHDPIAPLLMTLTPDQGLIFRIKTANIPDLLATMKNKWNQFDTGQPFSYEFMNDLFNKTYAAEQKTGTTLNIFAILTILVACLGLFGLATYTVEQRTKEIGIRKVLGASVLQIIQMLSKDFLKLVLISCLIAFPISFWMMNKWLQSFAYRIHIAWWMLAVAGFMAIIIALITVSFQAIKAAVANPVEALRAE
ncbi:MAG: FtsX-like permease family protein [Chitinophagaceae bacterium]|nr:MAG: FtsX-like permease family protein [Chitinophagaceae bacterium]